MKTLLLLGAAALTLVHGACPNACSGHGTCDAQDKCTCFLETDGVNPMFKAADCSQFTCPRGTSWKEPAAGSKHKTAVECSDAGICDRLTGECTCFPGYEGSACQRTACPNECSGHGVCRSNVDFAIDFSEAVHVQQIAVTPANKNVGASAIPASYYDYFTVTYDNAWDSDMQYGCLCDIGFRGPDCSLMECPTAEDPMDTETNDKYAAWVRTGTTPTTGNTLLASEWNNADTTFKGSYSPITEYPSQGAPAGDMCSGRGTCDHFTGICSCSAGFTGTACEKISALA